MLSETMTRAPLFSLISLTCEPPFPIMMEASCVTIRQRIWMFAEGGGGAEEDPAPLGAPEVVAPSPPSPAEPGREVSMAGRSGIWDGDGVDAAVSSTAEVASMVISREEAVAERAD